MTDAPSPHGGNPNGAPTPENTRPEKECPVCGSFEARLPLHIAREHSL